MEEIFGKSCEFYLEFWGSWEGCFWTGSEHEWSGEIKGQGVETGYQGPLPISSISEYQSAEGGTSRFILAGSGNTFCHLLSLNSPVGGTFLLTVLAAKQSFLVSSLEALWRESLGVLGSSSVLFHWVCFVFNSGEWTQGFLYAKQLLWHTSSNVQTINVAGFEAPAPILLEDWFPGPFPWPTTTPQSYASTKTLAPVVYPFTIVDVKLLCSSPRWLWFCCLRVKNSHQ